MNNLAEEFFGTEELSHDAPDCDSRRVIPFEKPPLIRVQLRPVGNPTPRFPRGLGAVLTAEEPIRTGWVLTRYDKEVARLFEHFAYLSVPNSLANRVSNRLEPSYTPSGNVLMHVDGVREEIERINWDFTQLHLPSRKKFPPRTDPTQVSDTQVFSTRFMEILERYAGQKHADRKEDVAALYEEALEIPLEWRVTQVSAQCPKEDAELRDIMMQIQREAYEASRRASAEFYYQYGVEGDGHLVVPASGLSHAWNAVHGRLGVNKGNTPLETTLYPIIPRAKEGPGAQRKFWGTDLWKKMQAA